MRIRLVKWTMLVTLAFVMAGTYGRETPLASPGTDCPAGAGPTTPNGVYQNCSLCNPGLAGCLACCGGFTGNDKTKCDALCEADHSGGTCSFYCDYIA